MIISASRRTDIPTFYSEWFINRLRAGYVIARNPMNPAQVKRVELNPHDVDVCVFWSKDFRPMMKYMDEIRSAFPVCVQHTLTPYSHPIEPNLPDKPAIIDGMRALSEKIGADCLVWRYDPIIFSDKMTVDWHIRAFERACELLCGAVHTCVFSFLQMYPKIRRAMEPLSALPSDAQKRELCAAMAEIARARGITLQTCSQEIDLSELGINHGACISPELIRAATGRDIRIKQDNGQRGACRCLKSVDIGAYHSCPHACAYCYANWGAPAALRNFARHDPGCAELIPPL